MPDLNTSNTQYMSGAGIAGASAGGKSTANYISPLGVPLDNLTQALHANDPNPVVVAAGQDITGSNGIGYLTVIKPAVIEAGHDVSLGFIGQNNNAGDITSISAGNDITSLDPQAGSYYYLYGPGTLLLEAGRDLGPFQQSAGGLTSGVETLGNGGNGVSALYQLTGGPLSYVPYLPSQGADIYALFGVGPRINYQGAISQYVNPASAGTGGVNFLTDIASILGKSQSQAWTDFQKLSSTRQNLLLDRAFLDFLTQVGTDYSNASSPYYGQYARAYQAISTMFPAAYGYTNNSVSAGGANGAATRVTTGQLNIVQSVLATGMGGDINIIGPGGNITVGATSTDQLNPNQEGILTFAGGTDPGLHGRQHPAQSKPHLHAAGRRHRPL